ncbi:MAG: hypothetical protein AAF805_00085 [Planctomycetota bacterium]
MPGFLYFIPNHRQPWRLEHQAQHALEHAVDGPGEKLLGALVTGAGPTGGPGIVLCRNDPDGRPPKYDSANQTWKNPGVESEGGPGWSIGWWNDAEPTARDVRRAKALPGVSVPLRFGGEWTAPVLRAWSDEDERWHGRLATTMRRAGGGWVVGEVVPEYRELWERSERVFQTLAGAAGENPMTLTEWYDHACELLQLNYRVSVWELSMLEALTEERCEEIVTGSCDYAAFLDFVRARAGDDAAGVDEQKKTEPSPEPPSEPAGASPVAAPASPSAT